MKIWQQHSEYLDRGEWHVHTAFGDGEDSVARMSRRAVELGIPLLAFTEHVRKELQYDFDAYHNEIQTARTAFPELVIIAGCEAKVLPNGSIDVSDEVSKKAEMISLAVHGFTGSLGDCLAALETALKHPKVNVWAHPGGFKKRFGAEPTSAQLERVVTTAVEHDVLFERNGQYTTPSSELQSLIKKHGGKTCRGSNVHLATGLTVA